MSRFQYAFMDRLKALPGVESVGYITTLPLDEGAGSQNITTPRIEASGAEAPLVRFAGAGGAYFQTMGIELLRGRYFERVEEERGLPNVIISQSAAELLFPGEDPLDKQVRPPPPPATSGSPSSAWSRTSWSTTSAARRRSRWCTCRPCPGRRRTS